MFCFLSFSGGRESCQIRFLFFAKWQLKIVTVSLFDHPTHGSLPRMNGNSSRHGGQEWTTLKRLAADYHNRLEEEAPRLLGIGTEPEFAIGQRALFLQWDGGNLLWDCITLLDGQTAAELNARGGICAIAISHPHYYTTMVDWAERFDAQIFLHTANREWDDAQESAHPVLGRNNAFVVGWSDTDQLRRTFRWRRGVALASRCKPQRRIAHRRHHPSRARSPLCELHAKLCEPDSAQSVIQRILKRIEPFSVEQICGAWWKANVLSPPVSHRARGASSQFV